MKRFSLKWKILLAFAFIGFVPLLAMSITAIVFLRASHGHDVEALQKQGLNYQSTAIEKYINGITSFFEIQLGWEYNNEKIIHPTDQKFLLEQILAKDKNILEVIFVDTKGVGWEGVSRLQDSNKLSKQDYSKLPILQEALKGNWAYGEIEYTAKGPLLFGAYPVKNRNGTVVMAVLSLVDLSPLVEEINQQKLGNSGRIVLIDKQGLVLAGSQLILGQTYLQMTKAEIQETKIVNFDWRLVSEWPTNDAYLIITQIQQQVVVVFLVALVLVLLLSFLLARNILNPLLVLEDGVRKVTGGDLDFKININSGDELEDFGNMFNKMETGLKAIEQLKLTEAKAEALAESLRKEKQLSKIKQDFINNTSHQLRTPVSTIRWSSELLVTAITDEKTKGLLEGVTVGAQQLSNIVHDLITVSNYGFGYKNVKNESVDLVNLTKIVAKLFAGKIQAKQIVYTEKLSSVPASQGDPDAIKTAIENLLDNAVTYTKDGGLIEVGTEMQSENILWYIKDNGIGITEGDQKFLFQQFFRATNSIEMKNVGTGLGLYICQLIIEGHGGKIWFESKVGQGSSFYFLLPKAK